MTVIVNCNRCDVAPEEEEPDAVTVKLCAPAGGRVDPEPLLLLLHPAMAPPSAIDSAAKTIHSRGRLRFLPTIGSTASRPSGIAIAARSGRCKSSIAMFAKTVTFKVSV